MFPGIRNLSQDHGESNFRERYITFFQKGTSVSFLFFNRRSWVINHQSRGSLVIGCGLQVSGFKFQVSSFTFQVSRFAFQVCHWSLVINHWFLDPNMAVMKIEDSGPAIFNIQLSIFNPKC